MQKSSVRWVILFVLSFGCAMLYFASMIFASRPTEAMEQFNMTQGQLTAISTIGNLPGAFFSVWLGHMFDKKGVRMLPGILLVLAAVCQIWRIFAADYMTLIIITFLAGFFFLPTQILQGKLLGAWFSRREMGTAMGIYGASAGIGTTCAFAVGGMIPTIRMSFIIIAVCYCLVAALWFLVVKMPGGIDESAQNSAGAPKGNLGDVVKSRNMWLLMVCGGLAVGASMLLNSYIINALLAKGCTGGQASALSTMMNVSLIVGGIVSGIVVSKVGRYNRVYLFICVVGAALYYAAYMLPFGPLTYVLVIAGGLIVSGSVGVNMTRIPLLPLTGDISVEDVGAAGGMNNTAVGICAFAVPTIVAAFVGTNYTAIFTIVLVLYVVIGIVGGLVMPELGEKGKLAQKARASAGEAE